MSDITLNVGETLRRIREHKKIPIETVADALNLRLSILIAIEADDPTKQIMDVYRKGYLRAYAKYLEVDSGEILDKTVSSEIVPPDLKHLSVRRKLMGSVLVRWSLVISLMVVAFCGWFLIIKNHQVNPLVDNMTGEEVFPSASNHMIQPVSSSEELAISNEDISPRSADQKTNIIDVGLDKGRSDDPISSEDRGSNSGEDHLMMSFSNDCWVELSRADSLEVYQDLQRAGDVLEFKGGSPYRVKLGYTPGVSVKFNGEIVALAPHTRNNVASIVLGQ